MFTPMGKKDGNARRCLNKPAAQLSAFLTRVPRLPSQLQQGRGRAFACLGAFSAPQPAGQVVDEKSRRLPLAPECDLSETLRPECAYDVMFQKPAERGPFLPIGGDGFQPGKLADRLDGKPKQESEFTMRSAIARELTDDDLAAIAVGANGDTAEPAADPDPTKH
jgi:hypothetical protein